MQKVKLKIMFSLLGFIINLHEKQKEKTQSLLNITDGGLEIIQLFIFVTSKKYYDFSN